MFDAEIGEDATIDIEDGGFRLARDFLHCLEVGGIGSDLTAFVFYAEFLKFGFRIFAPRAPLLNVEHRWHEKC